MDNDVLQGWPIDLCSIEINTDISFAHRGKLVSKAFVVEMALSGKSACRKGYNLISFNQFRIGAL
jgi:hypothetical protein